MIMLSCSVINVTKKTNKFISGFICLCLLLFASCEDQFFEDRSDDPRYIFNSFWREVDRHYSFFESTKLDWDSVYSEYIHKVNPATSDAELFSVFSEMLSLLNDAHVNIYAPVGIGGNSDYFDSFAVNPILAEPSGPYFEYYNNKNRTLGYGKLKNTTTAYIRIRTFEGKTADFEDIDEILADLEWSTALIIDVRSNRGGQISNGEVVASRFAQSTALAYEYRLRNGPAHNDFTAWHKVNFKPHLKKAWTERPVAVLTNRNSFSATEWFVLFMQLQSRVKVVGDTTGGGGAVPITRELPNGWILRVSNTQTRLASGRIFQRTGLYPDVPVWITKEEEQNNVDAILETAIQLLK